MKNHKNKRKYSTPKSESESEVLPNLFGLTSKTEVEKQEAKGFIKAALSLTRSLTSNTVFDTLYILNIHKIALEHLYSFAGKYRTVNLSKGSFVFPAGLFISQSMETFEKEILLKLPHSYSSKEKLVKDIAMVHGELLFIHPFREGNGRTARILANLMAYKAGYNKLNFDRLNNKQKFNEYILAIHKAAEKDYSYMEKIIAFVF